MTPVTNGNNCQLRVKSKYYLSGLWKTWHSHFHYETFFKTLVFVNFVVLVLSPTSSEMHISWSGVNFEAVDLHYSRYLSRSRSAGKSTVEHILLIKARDYRNDEHLNKSRAFHRVDGAPDPIWVIDRFRLPRNRIRSRIYSNSSGFSSRLPKITIQVIWSIQDICRWISDRRPQTSLSIIPGDIFTLVSVEEKSFNWKINLIHLPKLHGHQIIIILISSMFSVKNFDW